MGEQLKIAKMVSKANGRTGFYLDLVTVEVLGILEEADTASRYIPGGVVISNQHGFTVAPVKVDINGCFYIPLKKKDLDVLQVYPHYIGAFTIQYDKYIKMKLINEKV